LNSLIIEKGNGAPGRTRTCNPQVRSLVFYPVELQVR
jgi:hypothetical protein